MALQDTDLFVVYRPATEVSYKLQASALNTGSSNLPDGTEAGQVLEWNGTEWLPSAVIDGGTY